MQAALVTGELLCLVASVGEHDHVVRRGRPVSHMEYVKFLGKLVVWVHTKQKPQADDGLRLQRACGVLRVGKSEQRVVLDGPRVHARDPSHLTFFGIRAEFAVDPE